MRRKKAAAVIVMSATLLGVSIAPAMASINVINGNGLATTTGSNVVHLNSGMINHGTTTTLPAEPINTVVPWGDSSASPTATVPVTTSTGSSVVSLKGIYNNYTGSVSGVVQPTPTVAPVVPSTSVQATSTTADEQQMIELINQDRARNGLPALKVDLRLVTAARQKSEDIKANNYFTHVSPNFGYTASLFPAMGLNVNYWAENVGAQMTVEAAEAALEMDIPHQQNILDPNINYVGVGIAYNSIYGNVYTQEFVKE